MMFLLSVCHIDGILSLASIISDGCQMKRIRIHVGEKRDVINGQYKEK